jgi:hypothetical protein
MNSVILDVVIGLVFIYLIYSLFISIVGEMVSNWLGMRGRVLRQGITNLLTDIHHTDKGYNILRNLKQYFLYEPKEFKFSKAGDFYNQPSIKFLTQGNRNTIFVTKKSKPSYIKKENFSATLINMLREEGKGIHDWAKVTFSVVNNALEFDPETNKQLNALLKDADDDMEVFIKKLEDWYDEMMDRINGWYKRKLQFILFWLGIIVVGILNVDSIAIAKKLSKDETAREQMVTLAVAASDSTSTIAKMVKDQDSNMTREQIEETYKLIQEDVKQGNLILGQGWEMDDEEKIVKESVSLKKLKDTTGFEKVLKKVSNIQDSLDTYEGLLDINGMSYNDLTVVLDKISTFNDKKQTSLYNVNVKMDSHFESIDTFYKDEGSFIVEGKREPTLFKKAAYILKNGFNPARTAFWGFVITALALCLGAPFWFDLLQKLVALRSSGVKPKEDKNKIKDQVEAAIPKQKSNLGKTITNNNPVDRVIAENEEFWKALPGIISINKVLKDKKPLVRITHEANAMIDGIKNEIKTTIGGIEHKVNIEKQEGVLAEFLLDNSISNIKNKETIEGWGTVSGIVTNMRDDKPYLLSCAHVIHNSNSAIILKDNTDVIDGNKKKIGELHYLSWGNFVDAGIVKIEDDSAIERYTKITDTYSVSPMDALNEIEVTMYGRKDAKDANIIHNEYNYKFLYEGKVYVMYDLITIARRLENGSLEKISQGGDSGALVVRKSDKKPIGIVVGGVDDPAGKENLTFVIRIEKIMDAMKLKPFKS